MIFFSKFRLLLALATVSLCFVSHAQDSMAGSAAEAQSFLLYSQKNWKQLLQVDREIISGGKDYFYLRLRNGIALYELKRYRSAIDELRAALVFNASDETALEYLYYCYFFSGRFEEARKLKIKKLPSVSIITVEYGNKSSDSSHLFGNANYLNAGIEHYIKDRISLFHALTWFGQKELTGNRSQLQYYIRANIPLKNNFLFSPAFQFVNSSFTPGLPPLPNPPPPGNPHPPKPPPSSSRPAIIQNYFIASFLLTKQMSWLDLGIGSTAVINDSTAQEAKKSSGQWINNVKLTFYPLLNNRLALGFDGGLHTETNYSSVSPSYCPFISVWPLTKMNITVNYFRNQGMNTIENNGYLVNNSNDFTRSRWTAICSLQLSKHLGIYGLYELENKIEEYRGFSYTYTLIGGGIRIIP